MTQDNSTKESKFRNFDYTNKTRASKDIGRNSNQLLINGQYQSLVNGGHWLTSVNDQLKFRIEISAVILGSFGL